MKPIKKRKKLYCKICGKEFYLLDCQIKWDRGKYCSRGCSSIGHRRGNELNCNFCGKKFYRSKAEQDIGIRVNQYCSRQCYFKWREEKRKETTYLKNGKRHAHRVIAEEIIGRKLKTREIIHHIDNVKSNNNPSNLALLPNQNYHAKIHFGKIDIEDVKKLSLDKIKYNK
jgi:hypothetical protein